MEGREGVHVTFVKHSEMSLYQKAWSNHVIVALPPSCNYEGLGMIKDIIKVSCSYMLRGFLAVFWYIVRDSVFLILSRNLQLKI